MYGPAQASTCISSSTDFKGVKDCLQKRFSPDGNELEWQFRVQGRVQKPEESLAEFAGELRLLAGHAYPRWSTDQQLELARYQFIQGVRLSAIQLQLMCDMPATLDAAQKLETVEVAQKRLHQKKFTADSLGVHLDSPAAEMDEANLVQRDHAASTQTAKLRTEVCRLTQEVERLRNDRSTQRGSPGRGPICWNCHRRGHLKWNCPNLHSQH